jgi:hypothetical protein
MNAVKGLYIRLFLSLLDKPANFLSKALRAIYLKVLLF